MDSLLAAFNSLGEGNLGRESFELFGYDFMIDENFKVYLIDDMSTDNSVSKIQNLIDDDLKISETFAILRHLCRKHKPELLGIT